MPRSASAQPPRLLVAVMASLIGVAGSTCLAQAGGAPPDVPPSPYLCGEDARRALLARSPATLLREADVALRAEGLRLAELGLSSVLTVEPSMGVGRDLVGASTDLDWEPGLDVDASLGYRYDQVAQARARAALVQAERRLTAQVRADVLLALLTQSRLRSAERAAAGADAAWAVAQAATVAAEAALATARAAAAEAREASSQDGPAATPTTALASAQLDLRAAELEESRARAEAAGRRAEVGEARALLAALGVPASPGDRPADPPGRAATSSCLTTGAPAGPDRLPIALPAPPRDASAARAALEAALELARAQRHRAALAPLNDLSLTAQYQEGGARATAELALDGGRPTAEVALRWRDVGRHAWSVGVEASLRLDDTMGAALVAAEAEVAAAEAALATFDAGFSDRVEAARAATHAAWLELTFAAEELAIAEARLNLATTERDATRARTAVERALNAWEREYQAYLRALDAYLTEFDLPWNVLLASP